jgi:hypothetical protein
MTRIASLVSACLVFVVLATFSSRADAQNAFGRVWGGSYRTQDWNRLYHYPYVFYPQNFFGADYYRSSADMYYRYPPEMRIPVYNKQWWNFYGEQRRRPGDPLRLGDGTSGARYHWGHHFILDVF